MAELNSFLKNIADAIRSKKGTTDKINASNFAKEIASITGGGGAVIKTKGDWVGTAVPESGLVDKVYFNTNLSVEEFVEIAETLTFASIEGTNISVCFTDANMEQAIVIMKEFGELFGLSEDVYVVMVATASYGGYLFQSQNVLETDWIGWNPEFTGVVDVNMENMLSLVAPYIGYTPENENLSGIFSITPFVQASGEDVLLSGEYDGSPVTINIPDGYKGTVVPTNGYIEKIYINTKLSNEEVINICDTLTFVPFNEYFEIWACFSDEIMANGISIIKPVDGGGYELSIVVNGVQNVVYDSSYGWDTDVANVVEFNMENNVELVGASLGFTPENDKANLLFSITPFEANKPNSINVETYLNENKLP